MMDPYSAAAMALPIIAGLIGNALAAGDREKAQRLREEAVAQYGEDILPHLEEAVAEEAGRTEFEQSPEDDALRAQQLRALSELQNVYQQEGMTEQDRAALALGQQQVAARLGGQYQDAAQQMARRGMGQSAGLQGALYAQAGQTAGNEMANMASQAQIAGRGRALQALQAGAGLAGDIRGQDWQAIQARAAAQDRINQFNATQRTQASDENARREMSRFGANMDRLGARTNAMGNLAAGYEGSAQATQQAWAGAGAGASTAAGGASEAERKRRAGGKP